MSLDLSLFNTLLEKSGLSLNRVAQAIIVVYVLGLVNFSNLDGAVGFSIPVAATIYAVGIFLLDKIGTTVYPRLHPDVACQRCGGKQLRIIKGSIKCQKCDYIHTIGREREGAVQGKE